MARFLVFVMSVTSLHMHNHNHGLPDIGLVIMAHTLGMYGLSIVNGSNLSAVQAVTLTAAGSVNIDQSTVTAVTQRLVVTPK